MHCSRTVASAALLLACSLAAQTQMAELPKLHLPADLANTRALALGDLDGDGDLDLVTAIYNGRNRLYLNDGFGVFTQSTTGLPTSAFQTSYAVALLDVEGDGDLDIVFGRGDFANEQDQLLLNDGSAHFTDATAGRLPSNAVVTYAIAVADFDRDGDPDLLFSDPPDLVLLLNDGSGVFTPGGTFATKAITNALAVADVEGDGDLDIIQANKAVNRVLLDDGNLRFTPSEGAPSIIQESHAVQVGDVDGDGDPDLFYGNGLESGSGQPNRLYLNDGAGRFVDVTATHLPADADHTYAAAMADLDGDGDLDILVGNRFERNKLYANDGSGHFTAVGSTLLPLEQDQTWAFAAGDVDGDGDLDAVVGNDADADHLLLADGTGAFIDASARRLPVTLEHSNDAVLVDVDADGDLDVVFASSNGQNRLEINDGNGGFADETATRLPPDQDQTAAVSAADVDGDGDPDLVFANRNARNKLYLNDGGGNFSVAPASQLPGTADERTECLTTGDVNGDGAPDILFGNGSEQNRLLLNDGTGTFTDRTAALLPVDTDETRALVLVDIDADGDLDLAVGNRWWRNGRINQNKLYLNTGSGLFRDVTPTQLPVDDDTTLGAVAADVDADGDFDLVFGNNGITRLYLNDGRGFFHDATAINTPNTIVYTEAIGLADVDDDGDPDLVLGDTLRIHLYLNDGAGVFRDASTSVPGNGAYPRGFELGDLDGDGDLDLVVSYDQRNSVWINLLRQLHSPLVVAPGRRLRLAFHARFGPPRSSDLAAPFLSAGTAHIVLPGLGSLAIDPTSAVALPAVSIPQPAGSADLTLSVPASPSLVGASIFAQALWMPANGAWRLTNATSDRIER